MNRIKQILLDIVNDAAIESKVRRNAQYWLKLLFAVLIVFYSPAYAAQASSGHSVTLTWAESDATVTSFNVYRLTGICPATPVGFTKIASATTTTYTDTSVGSAGATYCYYVTGVAGGNESAPSNMAGAVLPIPSPVLSPAAPK